MSASPARHEEMVIGRLKDELGEVATTELFAIIAWENFRARFNHAVGAEAEGFEEKLCALPKTR